MIYMFAIYDYTNYNTKSIVHVTLSPNIKNDQDFDAFLNQWIELYHKKRILYLYLILVMLDSYH